MEGEPRLVKAAWERAGAQARSARRTTGGRECRQITPAPALRQKVGNCDHRFCFTGRKQWERNDGG